MPQPPASLPPCLSAHRLSSPHCSQVEKLELEPHLNTCFRHFMLFTLVRLRAVGQLPVASRASRAEPGLPGTKHTQRGQTASFQLPAPPLLPTNPCLCRSFS